MGATVNENLNENVEVIELKSQTGGRQTFLLKTKKVKIQSVPLSCKKAAELLLTGCLGKTVCRFCLKTSSPLSALDQIIQIAGKDGIYKVTIRDMVGSFYPINLPLLSHIPSKICETCLNQTISCYLFSQQCDQAERAMINYLEDVDEKINKLDPMETQKKRRGRHKLNPNYNQIHVEHINVIDYAEPQINLVNRGSALFSPDHGNIIHPNECLKCWEIFPNTESLLNHEKSHPKTMNYNCRFCSKSFVNRKKIMSHLRNHVSDVKEPLNTYFKCKDCGYCSSNYGAHLQHIEKHKFLIVFEHVIEKKMDKLCSICFEKRGSLADMNTMVSLHGGYPLLTGDRSIMSIVNATIPDIPTPHSVTGTKICSKCFDSAINTYIFINHAHYVRNRLDICINKTLDGLNGLIDNGVDKTLFVEIDKETILPSQDDCYLENAVAMAEDDMVDDEELSMDVLEDEFREDSEENDDENNVRKEIDEKPSKEQNFSTNSGATENINVFNTKPHRSVDFNLAKQAIKTYTKKNIVMNGFPQKKVTFGDVTCSEFLTFKKDKERKIKKTVKLNCQICRKSFLTEFHFVRHSLRHISRQVKCHECGQACESKFELREHFKMAHILKEQNYSSCRVCRRAFVDRIKLRKHLKCHVKPQCQLCDKHFVTQEKLNSHVQRHKPKLVLKKLGKNCSFCEKLCTDDNQLSLHVNKSHLQIKPYQCDMCEAQFYTDKNLRYHKKVHSLKHKEKCAFCNKILKCRKSLVIHVRKHIGVKPWHCNVCKLEFYSENKLLWHMKRQHGGRYVCNCCKSAFSNQNDLKFHVDTNHVTRMDPNFYVDALDS